MTLRWKIYFVSLNGTQYTLEVYDINTSTASCVTLQGASQPFKTNEKSGDDFYTPIRTQTGYIRFILEDADELGRIMPSSAIERPVILRNATNEVVWMGFLGMEQYSQPWDRTPYIVEIPVVSVMEAMKGVEFTQNDGYSSLFSLMCAINAYCAADFAMHIPSETPISDVCVNNNNFRTLLTVAEREERSTSNVYECISLYEAVEDFCKYFGLSLCEYKGDMYFIVHNMDDVRYEDVDIEGHSEQSIYGTINLESLNIRGNNNLSEFSKPYRRIVGNFEIGRDLLEDIYELGDFVTQFTVSGAWPTASPYYLLFNGNSEVVPYANGVQNVVPIGSVGTIVTGGQIERIAEELNEYTWTDGRSYDDCLLICSSSYRIGSPETAMKINIPKKVYVNGGESVLLNIKGNIKGYDPDISGSRLYCKIKFGNYWLKSTVESSSTYVGYSWTTEETTAFLVIHDNAISMYQVGRNIPLDVIVTLGTYSGFCVMLPTTTAGYYDLSIEFMANAQEDSSEFEGYTALGQAIESFEVKMMRGNDILGNPTPNLDKNSIIRIASNIYSDDYEVESNITTRRGAQYGAGAALDLSTKGYITTEYDRLGVERRAALVQSPRKMITVDVSTLVEPWAELLYNSQSFAILEESVDWHNDIVKLKIIENS